MTRRAARDVLRILRTAGASRLRRLRAASVFFAIFLAACATRPPEERSERDPLEGANRSFFKFNDSLDRYVMKPVARCYERNVPERIRKGVSNFFANLSEPDTVLNDFLQGKIKDGASDVGRFATNTTVGVLGVFDVATHIGLIRHEEDLGQTLAVWGVGEGPYLVIPLEGPSTLRDLPGLILSSVIKGVLFLSASSFVTTPLNMLSEVDKRYEATGSLKAVDEAALDRYVYIREAYRQHRIFMIYDGDPPPPVSP